ncbi:MAG: methylenetetrahydrofolate reductase [bacterium]|nr:methylenetetrahydrofolate reductase [bacterium]
MIPWFAPERYLNEVTTPKQDSPDIEADLVKFAEKYTLSQQRDFVICITDNPLGMLSFEALETIEASGVTINPERLIIHLNTFHRKQDLDRMLRTMAEKGVRYLLTVSGDGNERLHRLTPDELGFNTAVVTSVELMRYIHREYPDTFVCGVAYNHYEPAHNEREKLKRKLDAGAAFIITQPVIRRHENVDWLADVGVPVVVEAWMSKRIDLVAQCVGYALPPEDLQYEPLENLKALRRNYPAFGIYLALLGMKKQIHELP